MNFIKENTLMNPKSKTIEADVVVIGAGGAGLAAAVAAAEKGATVLVLEKRRVPGGNSAMAGGLMAAESYIQKQNLVDARRDELFKITMNHSHWKINPRIMRAFIDKSADTIQWLENNGVVFAELSPMFPNQHLRTFHIPRKGGAEIIRSLKNKCQELGIEILNQTAATKIKSQGKEWAVTSKPVSEGEEAAVKTRSIIITTGGYGGSKELLKQYVPDYHENIYGIGLPHTGDGILMAREIGAAMEGLGQLQFSGPGFRGSRLIGLVASEPGTLWINKYGERYTDESIAFDICYRGNVVDRQPDKLSYTLFDENIKNILIEEGFAQIPHGCGDLKPGSRISGLDESLQSEAAKGNVKIAGSLDEIAAWIGAEPDALKSTVEEYNEFCRSGHDKLFVKDPEYLLELKTSPYYAIKCSSCFIDTVGGIKINERMEVLNSQDKPIPGLYAAGVCAGGWEPCFVLSGSVLGFAYNSGRIAGENAAKYK